MKDEKMNSGALPLEDGQVEAVAGGGSDCVPAAASEAGADLIRQMYLDVDSLLKEDPMIHLQMQMPGDIYDKQ